MFGYIASTKFDESSVWKYASISIFQEVGCCIKIHRGKVFDKEMIRSVRKMQIGEQVNFERQETVRGTRKYIQFTKIDAAQFSSCHACGKALSESAECIDCISRVGEKFEGNFTIVEVSKLEQYYKLVLRQGEVQFAFPQWFNGPLMDIFSVGDIAEVIGWRNENRITTLRKLFKKT